MDLIIIFSVFFLSECHKLFTLGRVKVMHIAAICNDLVMGCTRNIVVRIFVLIVHCGKPKLNDYGPDFSAQTCVNPEGG